MYFLEKEHNWMALMLAVLMAGFLNFSLYLMVMEKSYVLEWEIMFNSSVSLIFNFYMDWMSVLFFGFVSMISGAVLFFSGSYMNMNYSYHLFMFLVLMFVSSMFLLIFSLNLVSMLLGWDGLGITSYILVIFYKNEKSSSAGMITALSNRIGDAALFLSVACFLQEGSWSYMFMNFVENKFVFSMIGLAAMTKSAQIPFSAWLPAAMAAPTPVSALVHSSTLVTAGVYLLIRFNELMKSSKFMESFVYLSMMTTLMASINALFEVDFKKVVALSTLSQLGIMMMTLSMGMAELAYIHLLVHAIFKSLLFLCSGKIIHSVSDYQDIRKMGGLGFNLPLTGVIMSLSSYALCGVPFLSGFYSKDLIVEMILMKDNLYIEYIVYMMLVGLSASYSFRLVYLSMNSFFNQSKICVSDEEDWVMLSSKMILLFMSIISGAFLLWMTIPAPNMISLNYTMKFLALFSVVMGGLVGLMLCFMNWKGLFFSWYLSQVEVHMNMWNLFLLSGSFVGMLNCHISMNLSKLNSGWLEVFSGEGVNFLLTNWSMKMSMWLTNSMKGFLMVVFISVLIMKF